MPAAAEGMLLQLSWTLSALTQRFDLGSFVIDSHPVAANSVSIAN